MSGWNERPVVLRCGDQRLVAVLHHASRSDVGVLIVVGGPQYRVGSHRQFVLMARDIAAAGFPVFRFDHRGMGDSEGGARTFDQISDDIQVATDAFLTSAPTVRRVVLWGLCDAASACLMYAQQDARVHGAVIANPWVYSESGAATAYIKHYYAQRFLQRAFWQKLLKGQLNIRASLGDFIRKLARSVDSPSTTELHGQFSFVDRMRLGLERFEKPVLLLMSGNDLTAQEFRGLCERSTEWQRLLCRATHQTVELPTADHTFSARDSLREATRECLQWLRQRYGDHAVQKPSVG